MACARISRIAGRKVNGMLTIDDVIERFDGSLAYSTNSKEICQYIADLLKELKERRKAPEIIHCGECIYYDPPHVENNGVRYEYTEMPGEAFDVLGTGLVTTEYGINVGGRCCRDYNAGYDDDKRVYVPENNFCGRAERRTDDRARC
jgi:hypothetical protein